MLSDLLRRPPVSVGPDQSVSEAIRAMLTGAVGSVVVVDGPSLRPLGILTRGDLLERVSLAGVSLEDPVVSVMTGGVIALPGTASLHEGRMLLARHGLCHLVIVDGRGGFLGVVSRGDLYARRSVQADDLMETIQNAKDPASLVDAATRVRLLAGVLVDQGGDAGQVGEWISILNDLVVLAAIDIVEPGFDLPLVPWCWLVFGSEGRLEQTLDSDQDNGLIYQVPPDTDPEGMRRRFLPFAQAVNRLLDACGFPLCKGGIMAGNPLWCLSLSEWRSRFGEWILGGRPEDLLNATIFFDFRGLAGDIGLAAGLRRWLLAVAVDTPLFLRFMAGNALRSGPPLGMIRDFVVDRQTGMLDLKRDGSRPFVDAARIYALAFGIEASSTVARLRAGGLRSGWPSAEVEAYVDAFLFIQSLRLRCQRAAGGSANRVMPEGLNELERAFLKESFRQARKLQQKLGVRFQL